MIKKILVFVVSLMMITITSTCSSNATPSTSVEQDKSTGQIYLYGEYHGDEVIIDKEFELWYNYYHNEGMRHLFVELPFYGAEYLNLWMKSDNDDILEEIFNDIAGTAMDTFANKEFFKKIKVECNETVFHGIDVGHAYQSMGEKYLSYLEDNNLGQSEQYLLTEKVIEQGKKYYATKDYDYRENMLVENFIREFDKLENQDIMGIFGFAHTIFDTNITETTPNMASQLKDRYSSNIYTKDLSKDSSVLRVDTISVGDKEYAASYFGQQDISWLPDFSYRKFWRLENAYDDFATADTIGNVLPCDNYPMNIEINQIYVIDYVKTDGSITREFHRFDGYEWNGELVTLQIITE